MPVFGGIHAELVRGCVYAQWQAMEVRKSVALQAVHIKTCWLLPLAVGSELIRGRSRAPRRHPPVAALGVSTKYQRHPKVHYELPKTP